MKRTTVFLTDDLIRRLDKAAAKKGVNVAQLIRIYLSAMLDREKI
jgi:metal-responsive CopG/Arc/MetJ family transcriptional regulator